MASAARASTGRSTWLARAWQALGGRGGTPTRPDSSRFRLLYQRFREILVLNDAVLETIADVEDMRAGRRDAQVESLVRRVRAALFDVRTMVDDLNLLANHRHADLVPALRRIRADIEEQLPTDRAAGQKPLAISLSDTRGSHVKLVGGKMAMLAEADWSLVGGAVPPGLVITTAGFARFMTHNGLWAELDGLSGRVKGKSPAEQEQACAELQRAILGGEVPKELRRALKRELAALRAPPKARFAVRSSLVGEDGSISHAGQYLTQLDVPRSEIWTAYRAVVASAFRGAAVCYRLAQDLPVADVTMAVGCQLMVQARHGGVAFSRDYAEPAADRVLIGATPGLGAALVAGRRTVANLVTDGEGKLLEGDTELSALDLRQLARLARLLERIFHQPQDLEWALGEDGRLHLLQTRPMAFVPDGHTALRPVGEGQKPLLEGGITACVGAAVGPVWHYQAGAEPASLPEGTVIVAEQADPTLSPLLSRAAAVVTEVGAATSHLAIVAREIDVPCIVGLARARQALAPGRVVTVDAYRRRIFAGALPLPPRRRRPQRSEATTAADLLERLAPRVVPLRLTDPSSPEFRPQECLSLHDVIRYVHEQTFVAMFRFGELARGDQQQARPLAARLPFALLIYDVGGGIAAEAAAIPGPIQVGDLVSAPLRAFLEGLLEPRLRWDQPRPLSPRGFLSVMGQAIAAPPAEAQGVGQTSYAVVSDRYLNFTTKAGYHFSTVDTYCGQSCSRNYVHFRFAGGAAAEERRVRRIHFLRTVLVELGFAVKPRGDILTARFDRCDTARCRELLAHIGRLTIATRQLDMLMDSDGSPDHFARAFLADRLEAF